MTSAKMGKNKHLAFFKFTGVGPAYLFANEFSRRGHNIYEICPLAGESQLIIESNDFDRLKNDVTEIITLSTEAPVKSVLVRSVQDRLLRAYHSIELAEPFENLIILESDFVGELFFATNNLNSAIAICDFRCIRSPGMSSYIMLSGELSQECEDWANQGLKVSQVSDLTAGLEKLFKH